MHKQCGKMMSMNIGREHDVRVLSKGYVRCFSRGIVCIFFLKKINGEPDKKMIFIVFLLGFSF
jgi:hypothetical protein